MAADCIFCKIVKGEIPSTRILETDEAYSFLDINPINPGHLLVIPKKHFNTIFEIPDSTLAELMSCVKKLSEAVYKAVSAEGINILQNNYRAAGQLVDHAHFHVIPRFTNDGFLTSWPGKSASPEDLNRVKEKIVNMLKK